jgi:hypothetical protein
MGRVNDDNWLDEALNEAIHSADTQPDFENGSSSTPRPRKGPLADAADAARSG